MAKRRATQFVVFRIEDLNPEGSCERLSVGDKLEVVAAEDLGDRMACEAWLRDKAEGGGVYVIGEMKPAALTEKGAMLVCCKETHVVKREFLDGGAKGTTKKKAKTDA